jgi:hypothetical protein
MRRRISRVIVGSVIVVGLGVTAQMQAPQQHQHPQPAAQAPADMAEKCKAMMASHQKMMGEMKAADQRLDALVTKMNAASGAAKVDAVAAAVTELVAARKAMHGGMMGMHQGMAGHMMEHMQAGAQSMAMCPMMKGGGH